MAEEFKLNAQSIDPAIILPTLVAEGGKVNIPQTSWKNYLFGLRVKSGLRKHNTDIAKLLNSDLPDSERYFKMDKIYEVLHESLMKLSLQETMTIWWSELTHPEGNANNAFRAIAWKNSPVMKLLGIVSEEDCDFLNAEGRIKKVLELSMAASDPSAELANIIYNSQSHSKYIVDENNQGIPGYNCQCCTDRLQTALVRNIRSLAKEKNLQYLSKLCRAFNGTQKRLEGQRDVPVLTPPPMAPEEPSEASEMAPCYAPDWELEQPPYGG